LKRDPAAKPRVCFVCTLLLVLVGTAQPSRGQSGKPPAEALQGILAAACSQDAKQFSENLTARNAEAFGHMTRAAQSTLLKRFVLLDDVGQPRVENDGQGNITVFCVTPSITTQMQFGKVEVQDNLAYLPLLVKDSADTTNANARRITMGLVRENGQWKLLSLGLLLLDLNTLAEEWDRAEITNNEKAALAALKDLSTAIEKYRITYTRLPGTLAELGPPEKGAPKSDQAGLVEKELADGRKNGYAFRYVIVGANDSGAPAKYALAAIPTEYGRTGNRSFYRDDAGVIHGADHQGAVGTKADPKVAE
jgi:hypothetical protein